MPDISQIWTDIKFLGPKVCEGCTFPAQGGADIKKFWRTLKKPGRTLKKPGRTLRGTLAKKFGPLLVDIKVDITL